MATAAKKVKREKSDSKLEAEEKDSRSLCERVNCPTDQLTCVLEACHQCINREDVDTTNHPWTHLSLGEHVCNFCLEFFSKSQNIGYDDFYKWKKVWSANGRSDALIGTFISDQLLPYWTQCIRCNKWKEMGRFFGLTKDLAEQFICPESCDEPEDERVEAAKQSHWINTLLYPPYLTQSPAGVFLLTYYPDAVGMSATECLPTESCSDNFTRPFHETPNSSYALSLRPDIMDYDETLAFGEFACAQQMYLCLRNLVVAYWSQNKSEWLTLERCKHSVICRGLVRVRCLIELERIIKFLTMRGVINAGILPHPPPSVFTQKVSCGTVVVIGAGTAGLAAALHLYKHGVRVVVLEAKEKLGGRVHMSRLSSGSLLALGPDIISGSINNPIALMARQAKLVVQEFPVSHMTVLGKQNKAVSADSLRKAENRFLEILDLMYDWAQNGNKETDGHISIRQKVKEISSKLSCEDEADDKLTEEEEQILELHLQMLSTNVGADLDEVSAKFWNAHENYPQFGGPSFVVKQGIGAVLMKMAAGLNIDYNKEVDMVDYTDGVKVYCTDGTMYPCDKVVCTVSVAVLKKSFINFLPDLDQTKKQAISTLRFGKVEKVVLHFKKKFWSPKMHGVRLFTSFSVLSNPESLSHIIYDMSSNTGHVLAIYVYGKKLDMYNSLSEEEREAKLGSECIKVIKTIFPNAPGPMTISVSKWTLDKHIGLSKPFLPVNTEDVPFDAMRQPVHNKLYFAGEACILSHPGTVAGAYLSGIQQAIEILASSTLPFNPTS